jgi:hypothetical protein
MLVYFLLITFGAIVYYIYSKNSNLVANFFSPIPTHKHVWLLLIKPYPPDLAQIIMDYYKDSFRYLDVVELKQKAEARLESNLCTTKKHIRKERNKIYYYEWLLEHGYDKLPPHKLFSVK